MQNILNSKIHKYIRIREKTIFWVFAMILWSAFCFVNHISAQEEKATVEKPPLSLKVTTAKTKICIGTKSILIEAEMSNNSRQSITIDKKYLWNGTISIDFEKGKFNEGWVSSRSAEVPYTGDFLQLAPGQKYRETYNFVFAEEDEFNDFFKRTGQYEFKVHYQAVDLDDKSAEIRKSLYKNSVESNFQIRIIRCPRK